MRKIWIFLVLSVAAIGPASGFAQVVEWGATISHGASTKHPVIKLTAKIAPRWHMYGPGGGPEGQQPLVLKALLPAGVEFDGDWVFPALQKLTAGSASAGYSGIQIFERALRITSATGKVKIRVIVCYQACTHEMCGPPEEEELTAILITAAEQPPAPAMQP